MSEYWKKHFNANALKFPDSPLKQVEATVSGREVDQTQLKMIVNAIVSNLSLSNTDHVVDLCCGNGLITSTIAPLCKRVDGVDFSENLIANARAMHGADNVSYSVSAVEALSNEFFRQPTKGYMCFAIQHLTEGAVRTLMHQIANNNQWSHFFISGIPDNAMLEFFYDNPEKMAFYRTREAAGQPHLGKWWTHTELESLARDSGLSIRFVPQPKAMFTSHYRFDCLVYKTER